MLPTSAFPGPLPLRREVALALLDRLDEFSTTGGTFLTFVMVPVEERLGEYRFAGVRHSLAQAIRLVEDFATTMLMSDPADHRGLLRSLLEDHTEGGYDSKYVYPQKAPVGIDVPHRLILCVQSGAPYDYLGVCILEVSTLAGSHYDGCEPETDFPEEWREGFIEWVLEQGTKRFGPVPAEIEAAIQDEDRQEVWGTWRQRWAEFKGWEDLVPASE
jgi:hypothetical protein